MNSHKTNNYAALPHRYIVEVNLPKFSGVKKVLVKCVLQHKDSQLHTNYYVASGYTTRHGLQLCHHPRFSGR